MSFAIYLAGAVILIGGLVYGAVLMQAPPQWIAVGVFVAVGLSILAGVRVTRQKDTAN
ncbi:MAG: hypothetical protein IPO66_14475 [Rhodanobacteraceae bacterium]|nr:hypothetical protein [Rhodanobacteraceae bacterium]